MTSTGKLNKTQMQLKQIFVLLLSLTATVCFGQKEKSSALTDTTIYDYDELFSELDALIDSLYTPRSFGMVNVGVGTGFFQYGSAATADAKRQVFLSPTVGYFNKVRRWDFCRHIDAELQR
jgi:hypothetical protein